MGQVSGNRNGGSGLMREVFDQWTFVTAAYVVGIGGTVAMIAWAWISMRAAERRRERSREL